MIKYIRAIDTLTLAIDFSDYGNRKKQRRALKLFKELAEQSTPPTKEEVCKALSDELYVKVVYKDFNFMNGDYYVVLFDCGMVAINYTLPLKTMSMVMKFYEGLE